MANEVEAWWKGVPPVTKFLFAGSFVLTIAANYQLIHYSYLTMDMSLIFKNLEIWRLVTPFLFHGRLGFSFLMHMVFLVKFGSQLEKEHYNSNTAEYLFMVLFGGVLLLIAGYFMQFKVLGNCLVMMLIYLWSRYYPNMPMSFMFGLRFESKYLPWVLLGFDLLLNQFRFEELLGVVVGHIYFFLHDYWPNHQGYNWLATPQFFRDLFPNPQNMQRQPQGPRQPGYNWGPGNRVGGN